MIAYRREIPATDFSVNIPHSDPGVTARETERRREPRYTIHEQVEIRCLEQQSSERVAALAVDISRRGLRLEIASPLLKGSRLEIMIPKRAVIFGEVRYCRRFADAYYAGVAIEEVYHVHSSEPFSLTEDDPLARDVIGRILSPTDAADMKQHVSACPSCSRSLGDAEALLRRIRAHMRLESTKLDPAGDRKL